MNDEQTKKVRFAYILMACVAVARGTSFIFSKTLMGNYGALNVLGVRFIIAFIVLAIVFHKRLMRLVNGDGGVDTRTIAGGFLLGVLYTAIMIAEMQGLKRVDTGTCSFIENSAVVIVPFYEALIFRIRPTVRIFICALITIAGVGFLTISSGMTLNAGLIFCVMAALMYAGAIMLTGYLAGRFDPITIGVIQIGTMGVLSMIGSLIFEEPGLPTDPRDLAMFLMLALVCSCFGFTFQPVAQRYISADTAAVFTTINPLSTCIIGIIFAGEPFGAMRIAGALLILLGIFLSVRRPSVSE